ncbi:hypothetical protein HanIR_Chr03g0141591 [Helianthus annuus]|nr:hypothetical protein HanIR_Chr03g0141591 [Helianthus annuus]
MGVQKQLHEHLESWGKKLKAHTANSTLQMLMLVVRLSMCWDLAWKRLPDVVEEKDEVATLMDALKTQQVTELKDKCRWNSNVDLGDFSVNLS